METATNKNLWFCFFAREYEGPEPAFFDASQFEWARLLEQQYPVIRKALEALMENNDAALKPYFDEAIQYPPKNWKTIGFYFWGKKNHDTCDRFPEVYNVLKQIDGLVSASFNLLEPHSHIKAHFGDTNAVYRAHLGIKIPAGLPQCGFSVMGESRQWEEGKVLVFLDANWHEAFNESDGKRYILLLDIIRPEFKRRKNLILAQILAILSIYYVMALHPVITKITQRIPVWVGAVILVPLTLVWYIYRPVQNRINFPKMLRRFKGGQGN
jgi:hypothetical protein